MARTTGSQRRQGKAVTTTYGALTLVLLAVIVSVALALTPPAPPAVAEFAPQAQDTIEEAPKNQSSQFGTAEGGDCVPGQACELVINGTRVTIPADQVPPKPKPPTEGAPHIDKARVRRCVGNPPRQTEDPQSPPCVNYWEGTDNGGATYKGVTADEIRIAVPCTDCGTVSENNLRLLEQHFNTRYEFYGRKIRLMSMKVPANRGSSDGSYCSTCSDVPAVQQSYATRADEELRVFASTTYDPSGLVPYIRAYDDELARRKVLSVVERPGYRSTTNFTDRRPYQWSYFPPMDIALRTTGRFVCAQLAGRRAEYAGAVEGQKQRKFGVIYQETEDPRPDLAPLQDELRRCGSEALVGTTTYRRPDSGTQVAQSFQSKDVTTVICLCGSEMEYMWGEASTVNYEPEWLLAGLGGTDTYVNFTFARSHRQYTRVFGVGVNGKLQASNDEPWFWAARESDPSHPAQPASRASYTGLAQLYHQLLVLASGIQAAGPNLTPETFERGLQRLRFPNPGAATAPYYQARVGFGPGDYAMTEGYALVWYREAANPDGVAGLCYVDRGARWTADTWPTYQQRDIRFFEPTAACR